MVSKPLSVFNRKRFFYAKSLSSSLSTVLLNNASLYYTVLWYYGKLGLKKYFVPNEINIIYSPISTTYAKINLFTFSYLMNSVMCTFCTLLKYTGYHLFIGFKYYLQIKGLGYKVVNNGNGSLRFHLGYTNNIIVKVDPQVRAEVLPRKSKAIFFYSHDYTALREMVCRVRRLRQLNKYKVQGMFEYGERVKIKSSKKSIR